MFQKGCHAFKMLGNQWPNYMTAHPRSETSKMLLWEFQILSVLHAYRDRVANLKTTISWWRNQHSCQQKTCFGVL
jgi:hypothetical protein